MDTFGNASPSIYYSYDEMEDWDIHEEIKQAIEQDLGLKINAFDTHQIITKVRSLPSYLAISDFFEIVYQQVLQSVRTFANTGSSEFVTYTLADPSGDTGGSIRGKMIDKGGLPSFHFEIEAGPEGHYDYIRDGQPDWEKWLSNRRVGVDGNKYLVIPLHKARYMPTDLKPTDRAIVRALTRDGQPTSLFRDMMANASQEPKPFIPDIMKEMWLRQFKHQYEDKVIKGLIPSLVEEYKRMR